MNFPRAVVLSSLLILAQEAAAQAAQGVPATAESLRAAAQAMDCAALAAMPNAPMTRDACEAHKASGLQLGQAMEGTGGGEPGDDAMTCDQIAAELRTIQIAGVSAEHRAESQAAGEQLRQSQQQAQAAAMAMSARQTAETAAAAAARSNAVQGAVMLHQAAEQKVLAQRTTTRTKAAMSRTTLAIAAANTDLADAMQTNPRWGHLINMAAARCSGHPTFDGSSTP